MEKFDEKHLGGVPERFRQEGVLAHEAQLVRVGDTVEAIRNVRNGEVPLGTRAKVVEIIVEPKPNVRGFMKRIKIEGFEGEYNPQRFKKITEEK